MESQRSIIIPIAVAVLASAVVFGGLGYYRGKNNNAATGVTSTATPVSSVATPKGTNSLTPTATPSSRETYTSNKYNFSISYPKGWQIGEETNEVSFMSPETKAEIAEKFKNNDVCEGCGPELTIYYLQSVQLLPINGGAYTKQKSLLDYLKNEKDTITDYKAVAIGSYTGYWSNEANIGGFEYYYLEDSKGHIYKFTFDTEDLNIINPFLASFKLLK